jgi:hypothetical protein
MHSLIHSYILVGRMKVTVVTRAVESEGILGGVGLGKNVPSPTLTLI